MSQVAKLLSVRVRGSAFLGVRDGEDMFSSDPAEVTRWLADGWRTRYNHHRSRRHTFAHGFFDQAGADEQGRVLVPIGRTVDRHSDKEARVAFSHLAALPMQVLQSPERIEARDWFAATKRRATLAGQGRKPGRMPMFKSRKRDDAMFVCWFNGGKNANVTRTGKRTAVVTITGRNPSGKYGPARTGRSQLGWSVSLRIRWTQPIREYTAVTVNLTRGQLAFTSPPPARPHHSTGDIVGVDVGAVHTATTSNGEHFTLPDMTADYQEMRALDRRLAKARVVADREGRDWRTSNRYQQTRRLKQAVEGRIVNRRRDFAHKTANALVDTADVLVFENLNLQTMTRKGGSHKRGMNRVMARAAIGQLREIVTYKATAVGVDLVYVPAHYTSQRCNACGHISKENRKSQAVFSCVRCRHTCNADINAARNIRDLAAGAWTTASLAGSESKTDQPGAHRVPRKRPARTVNRKPPTPTLRG